MAADRWEEEAERLAEVWDSPSSSRQDKIRALVEFARRAESSGREAERHGVPNSLGDVTVTSCRCGAFLVVLEGGAETQTFHAADGSAHRHAACDPRPGGTNGR